jgi:hypothetical protein
MSIRYLFSILLAGALGVTGGVAFAKECPPDEPDSVQISWNTPCEDGSWLFDPETGCRMWDWHPAPEDTATWTGACKAGLKEGRGVVQWYEHGRPIDRFEGTYRAGKREGFGRYDWTEDQFFEGHYQNDVPNGFGRARIAGQDFTGRWVKGCLKSGQRVVAIGTARSLCGPLDDSRQSAKRPPDDRPARR